MVDANEPAPTLMLGIGNLLMGDDGLGVHAAQALMGRNLPPGVEVCEGGTAGLDLLETLARRRRLVVIDAIAAAHPPGTVLRLTPEELTGPGPGGHSLHHVGIQEVLTTAAALGQAPTEVIYVGAVPATLEAGLELSPPVAEALSEVLRLALEAAS